MCAAGGAATFWAGRPTHESALDRVRTGRCFARSGRGAIGLALLRPARSYERCRRVRGVAIITSSYVVHVALRVTKEFDKSGIAAGLFVTFRVSVACRRPNS